MTFLARKITNIQMTIQICTQGTYKIKSKIGVQHFQICYFQIFGLCVVFLVFMALKVKPKILAEFFKPLIILGQKNIKIIILDNVHMYYFLTMKYCENTALSRAVLDLATKTFTENQDTIGPSIGCVKTFWTLRDF